MRAPQDDERSENVARIVTQKAPNLNNKRLMQIFLEHKQIPAFF